MGEAIATKADAGPTPRRVRADDRVSAVIARDERLIDVFASVSPAFERLRNPWMRKTMARLVTVAQAARIGGVDLDLLLRKLDEACGVPPEAPGATATKTAPVELDAPTAAFGVFAADRIVDLDVREDLRAGREPFHRIMTAARELPADGALRVRATFEPVPLYAVLGRLGLAHATERLADDDWIVWFRRDANAAVQPPPPAAKGTPVEASGDDVVVLDVRGLEPPDPMMRTLEALAHLPRGKTLVQINARVPQHLLPLLEERGFVHEVRPQSDDLVRVFIRHAPKGGERP